MSSSDSQKSMRLPGRHRSLHEDDAGSAVIEFIALATMLLIPAVWFLVAVAQVQAASYAATGAADQAAKMYVSGDAPAQDRAARSEAAVVAVLADFDIDPSRAQITQHCPEGCETDGATVGFTVEVRVPLPLVPEFGGWQHRLVTVTSNSAQVQDR